MRFFALSLLLFSVSAFSEGAYWQDVLEVKSKVHNEQNLRMLTLDKVGLQLRLSDYSKSPEIAPIVLPLPNGDNASVKVIETQTFSPELANKFPTIKTYKLVGIDDPQELIGRMEISQQGAFISLSTATGHKIFIEPVAVSNKQNKKHALNRLNTINSKERVVYSSTWGNKNSRQSRSVFTCQSSNQPIDRNLLKRSLTNMANKYTHVTAKELMIYRIAISATQSYVDAKGGTKASAMRSIASIINRINEVYERDAGIRLEIVANNERLIAPVSAPFSGSLTNMISQNQRLVDKEIGSQHYDIGHLFTATGGGLAFVQSACREGVKAKGVSGNLSVGSERYSLEFVAHEIGHQFGATHTFNSNEGLCTSSNRHSTTAYEPGSGSTIMSYIGICGSDNLQNYADAMFHIGSIQQILEYKKKHYVNGCGFPVFTDNNAPEVNAGSDYVIPVNTPFELSGDASDVDKDHLLFSWQQVDAGIASNVNVDKGNNALFRAYLPTTSKHRRFPRLNIGNRKGKIIGEALPQTNRLMHFKFVAQDSSGATVSDNMIIKVVADGGAFSVEPIASSSLVRGGSLTVQWVVADTDLPPISCAAVDIALSVDKGLSFAYSLVKAVPNSGYEEVTLPDIDFDQRDIRIKLSCSDNVFFAISPLIAESDSLSNALSESLITDTLVNNLTDSDHHSSLSGAGSNQPKGAAGSVSLNHFWLLYILFTIVLSRKKGGV